jgi:Flp pilus assembly protein TadD
VLAAQDRWGEAVTAYIAAQAASPADPLIGNALGYAQLRTGQAEQAVETLKRALDLAPDIAQGHDVVRNNLALALTASGRIDEATALVARVRDSSERLRLGNRLAAEAARLPAPRRASEAIVQ